MKNRDRETPLLFQIRSLSHILDNAIPIPGTSYRIGIDPLLGLLPGVGDWLSGIVSAYMLFLALRLGLPVAALTRMLANLLLDLLVGMVPVVGDIFDFGYKANARNLHLIESYLDNTSAEQAFSDRSRQTIPIGVLVVGLVIVLIVAIALGLAVITTLLKVLLSILG
jgi:hypothetical protein